MREKRYGDSRVRYVLNNGMRSVDGNGRKGTNSTTNSAFEKRLRLGISASPAENLTVDGRLKYDDNSWKRDELGNTNTADGNHNSFGLDKLSLNWNHNNTKVSLGRTEVSLGQGLLWWENPVDGAYIQHKFGSKVTATLGVGDISATGWNRYNTNAQFAEVAVQASPVTRITLANMRTITNSQKYNGASRVDCAYRLNQFALGVNSQVADKWNVIAEAVTNNVGKGGNKTVNWWGEGVEPINKHGFWTRITYGKQDWKTANTWQVYGEYMALGNAAIDSKYWGHRLNVAGSNSAWEVNGGWDEYWGDGVRGFGIGVSYMLAANTNLDVNWYKLKPYDEAAAGFSKYNDVATVSLVYSF